MTFLDTRAVGRPFFRRLGIVASVVALLLGGCATSNASRPETTAQVAQGDPLRFTVPEGRILNSFFRQGPQAAHLLLSSGVEPRVLVAFPAGNTGVGLWFEPVATPVTWTQIGDLQGVTRADSKDRPLHGMTAEATLDAARLTVREGVLSNIRVLRDYQALGERPDSIAATPTVSGQTVTWSRDRLDNAAGYALSVEVVDGTIEGGNGSPVSFVAPNGGPLRVRITALNGETPLTPIAAEDLLTDAARPDQRSRDALAFLSYEEKFLAGSWRFDTYFGRDTLMSLRLLAPVLQPEAMEAGLGSVIDRLAANGEVAHEEDIGEFAVLRNIQEGRPASGEPIFDYAMVDDDFMLAPVMADYLLDQPGGTQRAEAFLSRQTPLGETYGHALARNLAWVVEAARPFAGDATYGNLIAIKAGRTNGQWRDSGDGLGGGVYAYDVNAVFVPAALNAIERLRASNLLQAYLDPAQALSLADAYDLSERWQANAPDLFLTTVTVPEARRAVTAYARQEGVDPAAALAALPAGDVVFNAVSLDAQGRPVPVVNSDDGFALLFLDPPPAEVERAIDAVARPFPAGLQTEVGLLVANPVFGDAVLQAKLGRNAYHGTVVWSWQQAVMAAGLEKQLARDDLAESLRAKLTAARANLWRGIDGAREVRTSELWSWSFEDGRYAVQPFGQRGGDQDESNAAQLWSTVFLALRPPSEP